MGRTCFKGAENIKNPEDFKEIYAICPDNSKAKKVALEKMLTFC